MNEQPAPPSFGTADVERLVRNTVEEIASDALPQEALDMLAAGVDAGSPLCSADHDPVLCLTAQQRAIGVIAAELGIKPDTTSVAYRDTAAAIRRAAAYHRAGDGEQPGVPPGSPASSG